MFKTGAPAFTVLRHLKDLWLKLATHSSIACSKSISASYLLRPDSAELTDLNLPGAEVGQRPAGKNAGLTKSVLHFLSGAGEQKCALAKGWGDFMHEPGHVVTL